MFKGPFKGNEIKIIVYGQYLLNYETPIKTYMLFTGRKILSRSQKRPEAEGRGTF